MDDWRYKESIVETYNHDDENLYIKPYLFIKGFATGRDLTNTLKALPFGRMMHDGQYRKGVAIVDEKEVRLPYYLHCLKVCSTLISLCLPLEKEEEDILLCSALLHDVLEDRKDCFSRGGIELYTEYGFPKEVYDIVRIVSKRSGAEEEEVFHYFNNIKSNKYAMLIKLADRSHNVEDLYVMKIEKLHKYVKETRDYIYPLCTYGKAHYPELSNGITILKSKILSLTELTETLTKKYEAEKCPSCTIYNSVCKNKEYIESAGNSETV